MFKRKTPLFAKLFLSAGLLALVSLACNKDDEEENNMYNISASLSSANEVQTPAVSSPATGALTGTYDANTNTINYNIVWANLTDSVTGMHFHGPATTAQNAGVMVGVTPSTKAMTGNTSGNQTVVDSVETHILAGRSYFNVHSKKYPGGEIRGQVTATKQ